MSFSTGGSGLIIFRMPGNRNAERETKILVRLAVARGIARIPENAGRTRVEQLVESLRSHASEHGWSGGEEAEFDGAVAAYFATWPATVVQNSAPTQEDSAAALPAAPAEKAVEWKFTAVQATYNCTSGEWASSEKSVQIKLFQRTAI